MEIRRQGRGLDRRGRTAARRRTRRLRIPVDRLALALILPIAFPFGTLGAQATEGEASVRVVEVFDPSTGERTRRVAHDLSPAEIRQLETALTQRGYFTGGPDGVLDDITRDALTRFQRDRNLVVCGCPSYETVLALGLTPVVTHTVVGQPDDVETPDVEVIRPSPAEEGEPAEGEARRAEEDEWASWTEAFDLERFVLLRSAFPEAFHTGVRQREFLFPLFPFLPFHLHTGGKFPGHHHHHHPHVLPPEGHDTRDRGGIRLPRPGIRQPPPPRPSPPRNIVRNPAARP